MRARCKLPSSRAGSMRRQNNTCVRKLRFSRYLRAPTYKRWRYPMHTGGLAIGTGPWLSISARPGTQRCPLLPWMFPTELDTMTAFANSYEHLLAELERIDLLIRARVAHVRAQQNQD